MSGGAEETGKEQTCEERSGVGEFVDGGVSGYLHGRGLVSEECLTLPSATTDFPEAGSQTQPGEPLLFD